MKKIEIGRLRCEYKKNPIGIDVAKPRFSWQLRSESRNVTQGAYQIQVSKYENGFEELVWDSGKVHSDQSVHVEYAGSSLESRTRYHYRIRVWDTADNAADWSENAFWETGLLDSDEWQADWIAADWPSDPSMPEPSPMLRRTFQTSGRVKSARIYATALGVYELHLNGARVGDSLFTPGWTNYHKRLQYQTYDITDQLVAGMNAVGVILGEGWYKGNLAWQDNRNLYGKETAALFQMHVTYDDGREEIIASDRQWKASTGPILASELYHGETYDARLEKNDWCTAAYDDGDWHGVQILNHTKDILVAQVNLPTKVIMELKPVKLFETLEGDKVLDMGQNMVGWMQFSVQGKAGTEITLRHAEVLDRNGNFYTGNLRKAKQTNRYILKGDGKESFEPHFSFQGFRYVKIEGYPGDVSIDDFTAKVIYTDMEPTGSFECSDELINQLQRNIVWGQRGNFLDVPTDCPQRDERLGWTGDAQVFARTAAFNMDAAAFFTKWLKDLEADQLPNGGVPHVIPNVLGKDAHSSAAWADAAVIVPWTLYQCYGDTRILAEQYDSMKAWVEYVRQQGNNEYLWNTGFHFGDWLALDAKENSYIGATPTDFIATAFYAYSTSLLTRTARILHKDEDALGYEQLHSRIVEEFRKEFVTPNGRLAAPTQTAHVLALTFDLVEAKDRKRVADTLARYIEDNKYHLTTGFVGTPYLCRTLTQNGYNDTAYKLALQKSYPSWLYSVTKGATTIWEHWDSIKEDGSFWSDDMNSFNHYAYGSIGDWLYTVVAGLDIDDENPGYKHFSIRPLPGEGITYAKAELQSLYGRIESAWEIKDTRMEVNITIPPNTSATAVLPYSNLQELYENERCVADSVEGILSYEQTEAGVLLKLASGTYRFIYPMEGQQK